MAVRDPAGLEDRLGVSYLHPFRDGRGGRFAADRFADDVDGFAHLAGGL